MKLVCTNRAVWLKCSSKSTQDPFQEQSRGDGFQLLPVQTTGGRMVEQALGILRRTSVHVLTWSYLRHWENKNESQEQHWIWTESKTRVCLQFVYHGWRFPLEFTADVQMSFSITRRLVPCENVVNALKIPDGAWVSSFVSQLPFSALWFQKTKENESKQIKCNLSSVKKIICIKSHKYIC